MSALILIAFIGTVMFLAIYFLQKKVSNVDREFFKTQWQSIEVMSRAEASWVQAIVDADKLMDEALKQNRYSGKTTADRMVAANRAFSKPDFVWRSHKIRNKVVHETRVKLRQGHVNSALRGFKMALKDLGAL